MKSCPSDKVLKIITFEKCVNKPTAKKASKPKEPKAPKEPKKCPSGKILSPKGRCVKKDGPTAKKMNGEPKAPKAPKAPKEPKAPKAPKEPKAPKAPKEPKEKLPKARVPKERIPKAPKEPKPAAKVRKFSAFIPNYDKPALNQIYQVLGVSPFSTSYELKTAYRKLAIKYHPDKHANNSEAKLIFQEVTKAYEILKNKDNKYYYDLHKKSSTYGKIISDINRMVEIKNRNSFI